MPTEEVKQELKLQLHQEQQLEARSDARTAEELLDATIQQASMTAQIGAQTLVQLQTQKEQLKRVDEHLNAINHHLTRSERILKGMKSIGGAISNLFTSPSRQSTKLKDDDKKSPASSSSSSSSSSSKSKETKSTIPFDEGKETEAHEEEQENPVDQKLDTLLGVVSTLKAQAVDMRGELIEQNALCTHLDGVVDTTIQRLEKNNRTIKRIS